jgi:hypothetical protein
MDIHVVRQGPRLEMKKSIPSGPLVVLGYCNDSDWFDEKDDHPYECLFARATPRNLPKFSNRVCQFWARSSGFMGRMRPWTEAKKTGITKHEWLHGIHEVQQCCLKWAPSVGRLVVCVPFDAPSDDKIKRAVLWLCGFRVPRVIPDSGTEYCGSEFESYAVYAHELGQ